mgnify:CR=1 FL=1
MKLTNKFNLPETIINVIKRPRYDKGDSQISATEILNSPRIVQLKRKHWDELEQDASEMVWSLFGSAVHEIMQHGKSDHHIVEERLHTVFQNWQPVLITTTSTGSGDYFCGGADGCHGHAHRSPGTPTVRPRRSSALRRCRRCRRIGRR